MAKNKFYKINVWFLALGISMLIILVLIMIFSLRFLSGVLLHSFSGGTANEAPLNFEIERAKKLQW